MRLYCVSTRVLAYVITCHFNLNFHPAILARVIGLSLVEVEDLAHYCLRLIHTAAVSCENAAGKLEKNPNSQQSVSEKIRSYLRPCE